MIYLSYMSNNKVLVILNVDHHPSDIYLIPAVETELIERLNAFSGKEIHYYNWSEAGYTAYELETIGILSDGSLFDNYIYSYLKAPTCNLSICKIINISMQMA